MTIFRCSVAAAQGRRCFNNGTTGHGMLLASTSRCPPGHGQVGSGGRWIRNGSGIGSPGQVLPRTLKKSMVNLWIIMVNHGESMDNMIYPNLGVSENVVSTPLYPVWFSWSDNPVFKWLAIIEKINPTFSDKSIFLLSKGIISTQNKDDSWWFQLVVSTIEFGSWKIRMMGKESWVHDELQ